jgi:hypothetical protein
MQHTVHAYALYGCIPLYGLIIPLRAALLDFCNNKLAEPERAGLPVRACFLFHHEHELVILPCCFAPPVGPQRAALPRRAGSHAAAAGPGGPLMRGSTQQPAGSSAGRAWQHGGCVHGQRAQPAADEQQQPG